MFTKRSFLLIAALLALLVIVPAALASTIHTYNITITDTDSDGVFDGDDLCPLDGDLGNGVDADGCPNKINDNCDAITRGAVDPNCDDDCNVVDNLARRPECDDEPAVVVTEEPEEPAEPLFDAGDERLNQRTADRGASAAVYCMAGDIHIYRIDDQGKGWLALMITRAVVNQVGIPSVEQHDFLLGEAQVPLGWVRVYRLHTGEFQVNAASVRADGDEYSFIWEDCTIQH